jgi:hypothetical protein
MCSIVTTHLRHKGVLPLALRLSRRGEIVRIGRLIISCGGHGGMCVRGDWGDGVLRLGRTQQWILRRRAGAKKKNLSKKNKTNRRRRTFCI